MKLLNTKYTVAIIISLIIGASILGYGYLNYKYKMDVFKQTVAREEKAKLDSKTAYETCRYFALQFSNSSWKNECRVRNLNEDCSLSVDVADKLHERFDKEVDNCYKLNYSK